MFPTASSTPRPVRLPKGIRNWALESLHGKYGDEAMSHPFISLDGEQNWESRSPLDKYDAAIRAIAENAPLRLTPLEQIVGAATLGLAISHRVPACRGGEPVFYSVSHLTIDYAHVLREGINGYRQRIAKRLEDPALEAGQIDFLHSLQHTIDSLAVWHQRYLDLTREARPEIYETLLRVPFYPARNFREALQAVWFVFSFTRLCGNWPGFGRLDLLLGDYLKRDLAEGRLTKKQARELMASFFIKGCEWIRSNTPPGTGDAQHYQNIVLAGVDEQGKECANEVTYLILDIVEELSISDFPITVRLNSKTPERLLRKVAQVMRHGGGVVAVYQEEVIIRALVKDGYSLEQARCFANDGCWEVQVPGHTQFSYVPFDSLQIFNEVLGVGGSGETPSFGSAQELYQAFLSRLEAYVRGIYDQRIESVYALINGRWRAKECQPPCSVIGLFEEGCIDHAASYYDLGPDYTVLSPHIGGAPDVANSLYAIDQMVFQEGKLTLAELVDILNKNWEGEDALRLYAKNHYAYYGNDQEESDRWEAQLLNDFARMVHTIRAQHAQCPVHFIPGVSTFGRQIDWLPKRCAVAFGFRKGDILAGNASPSPGTDFSGVTAMIKSYCKANLEEMTCGAALDVKILPQTLDGEAGIQALKALLRGFVRLDGFFMQLDTVDRETLLAAQKNPEAYKTLSVRVSGWNARFVTLQKEWQDMIIERSAQGSL